MLCQFSISENGTICGRQGDQTGSESNFGPYYEYPWNGRLEWINREDAGGGGPGGLDIDDLARRVIRGEFGNEQERRDRLGANYEAVQARVNQMLG